MSDLRTMLLDATAQISLLAGHRSVAVVKVITPKTGEGLSLTQLIDSEGKLIGTVRADRTTQGYEVTATLDPSVQARTRMTNENWPEDE